MLKISEMRDVRFDGKHYPYVPPEALRISETLKLHRDWSEDVDPVTYEVIRHNLWHVNEEHGTTIQKVSGSPVAMYALDLNPSILTEDAEFVYFGPYMQYMSGVTDTQVKWILEHRSENPGIRDGDMFLANDPWVGAAHQQDVMLICPVFWQDELFCWVTNCLHQYDIGGITPSSFCPAAESAYDEGILIPPVKIVENGVIRRDIEEIYLRASRKPEMVALDFRAQLAGNTAARSRISGLIERYGPATVKGVMKRIIDNAETAFLDKMARLPDGEWQERTYVESCRPGDRRTHRVVLTVRKEGDRLTFREPRERAAGRGDERDVLRLAGLGDGRHQRAPLLGPVLRGRRGAPPHRLQPDSRHLQLRELPGIGLDGPDPGDGDFPLPRLQRALEDDPPGPRDAA